MSQFFDQLREVKATVERRRAEEAELKRKKEAQERMQQQFQEQRMRQTQEKDLFGQYATMRTKQMTEKQAAVAPDDVPVLGTLRKRESGRFEVREEKGSPRSPAKRVFSGRSGFFDYVPEGSGTKTLTKSTRRHVLQSVHSKRMSSHFDRIDSVRSGEHRGGNGDGEPRSLEAH